MTDLTIANTILAQLGGGRFLAMTGARSLLGGSNSLTMHLPASLVTGRANRLRVTLDSDDTYTVALLKYVPRKLECVTLDTRSGIYCEGLRETFERMTGLRCTL